MAHAHVGAQSGVYLSHKVEHVVKLGMLYSLEVCLIDLYLLLMVSFCGKGVLVCAIGGFLNNVHCFLVIYFQN
jgi:hypothetical protein